MFSVIRQTDQALNMLEQFNRKFRLEIGFKLFDFSPAAYYDHQLPPVDLPKHRLGLASCQLSQITA